MARENVQELIRQMYDQQEQETGPYNSLYYMLKKRHPGWGQDQLERAAYSDYYNKLDQEEKEKEAKDDAAKQALVQTGASTVGSLLSAALLGYFKNQNWIS